ncbi:MAG TPA: TolC family protein, partial [Spirochaetes bacterium]|nr:TolC family protein [Spirochaetota bacterium]
IPNNRINTSLSINKVLYSFGRLGDQVSIAEQSYKIALLDAYKARNDLVQNVITAFYTVLLKKQSLKVVFRSNRVLKMNVKHQKRKYKIGKTQKYEYLRVKIQYENDKITVLQARDDYIRSLNDLFTLIGKRPIGRLRDLKNKVSGSLIKKLKEAESHQYISSLDRSIERGRTSRIDLLKLVAQRQILKLNRNVTSSQWKPVLSAFGTLDTKWEKQTVFQSTGGFGLSNNLQRTTTYNVGVKLTIPLSELLIPNSATHSKTKSYEYQVKSMNRSIEALMATVAKEISDRYLTYQQSKGNIKRRKRVMNLSKETFKIARKRYNAGTIDYLNYKDIEKQYREARLAYYQELFNFNIAYLRLLESMGVFINTNI